MGRPRNDLDGLKAAGRADIKRRAKAERREVRLRARAERRQRWQERLKRWEDTLRVWERRAKRLAVAGSVLSGLATGVARLHHYIEARRVAPAELPKGTDTPTVATDFVAEPKPPLSKP